MKFKLNRKENLVMACGSSLLRFIYGVCYKVCECDRTPFLTKPGPILDINKTFFKCILKYEYLKSK